MCRRKGRRKNIKRKRKTRKREKVKKKGIKTKAMGNTEKRKRKRINTRTRRKSTRTIRRTRTRIKRKAASLRRLELPLYLGLLLEGNFTREMNIKIDTLAQIKGEMNISSEIGIETSALRKASAPISFTSSLASAVETEDSKFVQELDRRIRDAEKGAQSQLAERFPVECKRDEETGRARQGFWKFG